MYSCIWLLCSGLVRLSAPLVYPVFKFTVSFSQESKHIEDSFCTTYFCAMKYVNSSPTIISIHYGHYDVYSIWIGRIHMATIWRSVLLSPHIKEIKSSGYYYTPLDGVTCMAWCRTLKWTGCGKRSSFFSPSLPIHLLNHLSLGCRHGYIKG